MTPSAGEESRSKTQIILGLTAGYVNHFGKSTVNAISGASQVSQKVVDHGGSAGVFADFGFGRVGPGNFGFMTAFQFSFPQRYYDTGLWVRYRMGFATRSVSVPQVAPYVGLGAVVSFDERFLPHPYVVMPSITLGCDIETNVPGLFVGFGMEMDFVDPVGVHNTVIIDGVSTTYTNRRDRINALFRLGYRVF